TIDGRLDAAQVVEVQLDGVEHAVGADRAAPPGSRDRARRRLDRLAHELVLQAAELGNRAGHRAAHLHRPPGQIEARSDKQLRLGRNTLGLQVVSGVGGSALGESSWIALVISIPDIPSMAAWCTFDTTAKHPSGIPSTWSSPSMT